MSVTEVVTTIVSDTQAITVDTVIPLSTTDAVTYNSEDGIITISGENFSNSGSEGQDISQQVNWTKFVWDIDDSGAANHNFTPEDFQSVTLENSTTIRALLTETAKAAFESTAGFAEDAADPSAANAPDQVNILAGFTSDEALNPSETDAQADIDPGYSDNVAPYIVSFTSTNPDGAYNADATVIITATVSETILAGSSITVTLNSGGTAVLTADANGTVMTGDCRCNSW